MKENTGKVNLNLETSVEDLLRMHGWEGENNSWLKKEWVGDPKHWYHTLSLTDAFKLMFEESVLIIPSSLRWSCRYSDSMEPDKQGRWARIMYVDNVPHAWVTRLEFEGDIRYSARLYFPTLNNDGAHNHFLDADFEVVKSWCENELATYFKKIKQYV